MAYWPTIAVGIAPGEMVGRMNADGLNWVAVVPVKGTQRAKSRLDPLPDRTRLATAFSLDTVAALLDSDLITDVLVVTGCHHVAAAVREIGALTVMENASSADTTDQGHGRLNAAITQALAEAHARFPTAGLAVVTGDLPALTAADVDAALALAAEQDRSMIPDADGSGTTALLAQAGFQMTPRFGVGSRTAHESAGHVVLAVASDSRIRHDVDEIEDLDRAVLLGVGRHTRALVPRMAPRATGDVPVIRR